MSRAPIKMDLVLITDATFRATGGRTPHGLLNLLCCTSPFGATYRVVLDVGPDLGAQQAARAKRELLRAGDRVTVSCRDISVVSDTPGAQLLQLMSVLDVIPHRVLVAPQLMAEEP
jgi:hypothetical protein